MKAKDTLLLNKTTAQNPILARRAWFWHVASHFLIFNQFGTKLKFLMSVFYFFSVVSYLIHTSMSTGKVAFLTLADFIRENNDTQTS